MTAAVFYGAHLLALDGAAGRGLAFALLTGAAFGLVLQRSRFCFFCVTRDFIERRDARGMLAIVVALAVGTLGYHAVFGAFLPVPAPGRLPPGAHIGPVSWVLALGAFVFGIGMAISGSCISAHFYRLGEGATGSPIALLGAAAGFAVGFVSWNTLYELAIRDAPVLWLPQHLGYGGTLLAQVGALAVIAALLLRAHRTPLSAPDADRARNAADQTQEGGGQGGARVSGFWATMFGTRWPAHTGGILVGLIAVLAYFRSGPLGVTAELGSLARTAADATGWLPARLEGLDSFAGCATVVKQAFYSNNGMFIAGLVLAALASALAAGDFRPQRLRAGDAWRKFGGGLLMGWGAMVSLGCTVGVLLSGIMAGAVSGWVFAVFCLSGVWVTLRLRRAPVSAHGTR